MRLAIAGVLLALVVPAIAGAQTTFTASDQASLAAAIAGAADGDTIVLSGNITLTSELPSISANVVINGNNFTLSGGGQVRGLIVGDFNSDGGQPVTAVIQNLTIANTVATGGVGGSGAGAGGGGAGLGGALFVADSSTVVVSNVNIVSSSAVGGAGGTASGAASGGGGGGMGGAGGTGGAAGGGGGGVGITATGGATDTPGGTGIMSADAAGSTNSGAILGGNGAGGGAGGASGQSEGGAGGGSDGTVNFGASGGFGGFGGGGGGAFPSGLAAVAGGGGGFGGGGGGGSSIASPGGAGGFGGGGGGSTDGTNAAGGLGGGSGSGTGNGGGGGGLGGAVFVEASGSLTIAGAFTINGSSVTGGAAGAGATAGSAYGAGIFLDQGGFGSAVLNVSSSSNVTIADAIADGAGSGGTGVGSISKDGTGTLFLAGNNTYTGGTNINAGTVSVSSGANLGTGDVDVEDGATLAITGSSTFANNLLFGSPNPIIRVSSGKTAVWNGFVADVDAAGTLNLTGGGTLALGNATNSYSGGTVVTGGSTVSIAADGALGSAFAGLTLGDATTSGTLALTTSGAFASSRAITLGAGGGIVDTSAATSATLSGDLTGPGGLTKTGAGALTLATDSSYAGATTVNGGTLFAGLANVFGTAPTLQIGSAGTVDFNGFFQTINSLGGTGQLFLNGGASMTIGVTNADSTFAGSIGGSGGILKGGTGTLTLSGANTFGGGIFVLGGTVSAGADANLGGGGAIELSDSTLALTGTGTFAHDLLLDGIPVVNVSSGKTATWAGLVVDGASPGDILHVAGGGTLALANAANSYSGGTIVTGGSTLLVGADSALGAAGGGIALGDSVSAATLAINSASPLFSSRQIALGSLGATIDTIGSTQATLGGAITGPGGLTKTGSGTLTLAGANSYLGPTTALQGTLRAGGSNVFGANGDLVIGGGARVDLNGFSQTFGSLTGNGALALGGGAKLGLGGNNASFTFGGALTGNGGLVKSGSGTLTLTGANSYTGGTTVNGGVLLGNTTSLQGNIVNNATLAFDQSSNGTYGGVISGTGLLYKTGIGGLTLAGANTYSGGTLVGAGTLIGSTSSLQGTIENNAALVFDQTSDGIFNGVLFGTGTVTKTGPGALTFAGGTPVGGTMRVNQGTLNFSGVLAGDVHIGAGAALSGAGVIGGSLNLGGTIFVPAPGTQAASFNARRLGVEATQAIAVPSLVINGNLNATAGSVLDFTVTPDGAPPIVVNGLATLTGTHVHVGSTLTNLPRYSTYLGMTSSGMTVNGADAATSLDGIVPVLKFDDTSMYVTLLNENIPLSTLTTGPNNGPVAAALDRVKKSATGDLAFVISELTALPDAQLNDALHQLSGELHATKVRLAVDDGLAAADLVRDEISARDASDGEGPRRTGKQSIRWWFDFMGEHATFSPDGADHAVANSGGGAGGFDFNPSSRLTFGAGGSFSRGVMSMLGLGGSSSMTAPRAFGYGGLRFGPFGIHGGASTAANSYHSQRPIAFNATVPTLNGEQPLSNGVNRTAQGDQSGATRDQWSEWQDTVRIGSWTTESKIGWRRATYGRDQFTETGASAISLLALAQDLTTKEADVNIHTYRRSGSWRPNLQINFRRELGDDATNADVQFAGQPSTDFQVNGVPIARDQFHAVLGLTMRTALGIEYTIEYETLRATNENHQGVHFRVRFR